MFVSRWTVDYGDGPHPVVIPHAWGQDVGLEWKGPAVYRTEVDVPRGGGTLRFWGVSYAAEVFANGVKVTDHEGIWDAFDVLLPGGKVTVEVRVVKNGGPTYPVETVASGGWPHLFHTFGGLYREVELLEEIKNLEPPAPPRREPLPYVRGVVHRGWYPDFGHPNPDESTIRREVREIKSLGFNLVKFAGWVPPHRYFEILEAEGLLAWLELPRGNGERTAEETLRIVRQVRHHSCLVVWTLGAPSPEQRESLVETVRALTGSRWVTECPREGGETIGTFDEVREPDDLEPGEAFFDALQPAPRPPRLILLGRLAAAHAHRDLARLGDELPFWASALPELNATGVRLSSWLPSTVDRSRFATEPTKSGHRALMVASRDKEAYVRKTLVEEARARANWISGYAISELRDTPVASAGLFDDWGGPRISPEEASSWNGPTCLFPIPERRFRPRPLQLDPFNHFAGEVRLSLGVHAEPALDGMLWWRIAEESGRTVARGTGEECRIDGALEAGRVVWRDAAPGSYRLEAGFGEAENAWDLWVVERPHWPSLAGWRADGLDALPGGDRVVAHNRVVNAPQGILFLNEDDEGTDPASFWRGSAFEFQNAAFWERVPFARRWERLRAVSATATLDPAWLQERFGEFEVLLNRIDTSPHLATSEAPILVRAGGWIVTTLRPGGDGVLSRNPAGCALLRSLMEIVQSPES